MIELFKLTLLSTVGIVGILIIFGFILGIIENETERSLYRRFGDKSIIITGLIGTTIHELSHYIMCKIFLHEVRDVKLFSIKLKGNELGHVSHSYNKKNIYQRVGNFFIGVAPIIFGTVIIVILFRFLLPTSWSSAFNELNFSKYLELINNFNLLIFIKVLLHDSLIIIFSIFKFSNFLTIRFWIFLFFAVSISTHMSLSKADLRNSLDGIVFIFIISLIINIFFILLNIGKSDLISFIITYNILLMGFLCFALIFSLISLVISKVITLI